MNNKPACPICLDLLVTLPNQQGYCADCDAVFALFPTRIKNPNWPTIEAELARLNIKRPAPTVSLTLAEAIEKYDGLVWHPQLLCRANFAAPGEKYTHSFHHNGKFYFTYAGLTSEGWTSLTEQQV